MPSRMSADAEQDSYFRSVLASFATGVAVVTAITDQRPVGMTIQSFCSLSLRPPRILLCPAITSTSWPKIASAAGLCINLLAEDQESLARQFARSGTDKFAGVGWEASDITGSPVLVNALAWIDCNIVDTYPGGDHLIAVCDVLALERRSDLRPLIFFKSGFARIPE
jgi:3-hydroxy-9,10-secoandrosta-1,3,5(10)-triene-9,17-dione monooxygenase reductase component